MEFEAITSWNDTSKLSEFAFTHAGLSILLLDTYMNIYQL